MSDVIYTNVAQYLDALKAALAGAPAGLVSDALADCEEHLRGAIAAHPGQTEAEVFAGMAKSYGSPQEVAAAYRTMDVPPPGPFARPQSQPLAANTAREWTLFNVFSDPHTYSSLLYMLLSLVTGIFYFTWTVTGASLSAGFSVLIIGIPFFLLFVASVRLLSHLEGRIVEALLGVRMPRRLPASTAETGLWPRIKEAMGDLRTWSSLCYLLLMLPLGVAYFVIAVVGLAVSGGLSVGGVLTMFGSSYIQTDEAPSWIGHAAHHPLAGFVLIAVGLVLFCVTLHIARAIGWLHGRIAEHLLVRL